MQKLEPRAVEQDVLVMYCDRCGREIPISYKYGKHVRTDGSASISARGRDVWIPLIPPEWVEHISHSKDYHQANVDICVTCVAQLQEWFRQGR